jgi:tetratricopeptide (TPR) repeat protein
MSGGENDLDALASRINELAVEGNYEAAIDSCSELIDRYSYDDDSSVVARVAGAMATQCWCLRRGGDGVRLLAAAAQLNDLYGDSPDPWLSQCAASGQFDEVCWFLQSGDPGAALEASQKLINRFERVHDPEVRAGLGLYLLRTASHLAWSGSLGREPLTATTLVLSPLSDAATSTANWVSARTPITPSLRTRAWATNLIPDFHQRRERLEQALHIYDLLIAHYASNHDPAVHQFAVAAKLNRGVILMVLGRVRSARKAWRDTFGLSPTELAMITDSATGHPDGGYGITDTIASIISAVSSDSESPAGGNAAKRIRESAITGPVLGRVYKRLLRLLD